jgi:protein-S-isoprenylcysteine O-methyltransferase Ste14
MRALALARPDSYNSRMKEHGKKMIAPVLITLILIAYYLAVVITMLKFNIPPIFRILAVVFSVGITALLIYVMIERIREIKKGEEDDIGKY